MSRTSMLMMAPLALIPCSCIDAGHSDASSQVNPEPTSNAAAAVDSPLPRTVFVHLFEWRWTDIARECEQFLGPKGFAGVQISPPNEHAVLSGNPWYERYQPVSYRLESRSGTRAELADMVRRCHDVGVDVYADAVINHMSGQEEGVGYANTRFSHYAYPSLYGYSDFHHCGTPFDDISNYGDRWQVQNCELVNLADLNTGSDYVQSTLAGYLSDLTSLGVAGFRIDAAKHIDAGELRAILARVSGRPYVYQEVIDLGGEPIHSSEYTQGGDVIEFRYSASVGDVFKHGKLADLAQLGTAWGFLSSDQAVVFIDNHDNQRGHGAGGANVVTHKDGALYDLANVFMLAYPYGYPQVMSSYAFADESQGPPSNPDGSTKSVYQGADPSCFGEWVCEHRWRPIANMVAFRDHTASAFYTSNWWSNGDNQIAFSRGDRGFVAINREGSTLSRSFQTGMAAGVYCDVISGEPAADGQGCSGGVVTVDAGGNAAMTVGGMSAVAIHVGSRITPSAPPTQESPAGTVDVRFEVQASTRWGENIYVVGDTPELGSWSSGLGARLDASRYPIWSGTVTVPAGRSIHYKYIKRDAGGQVAWEQGDNRTLTTAASGSQGVNDTWR